jgi:hypothetical protein
VDGADGDDMTWAERYARQACLKIGMAQNGKRALSAGP